MTTTCGNCEEREATEICEQCEGEDSFFCAQCWAIHIQVKAFRKHTSVPLSTTPVETSSTTEVKEEEAASVIEDNTPSKELNLQKLKLEKGKNAKSSPQKIHERTQRRLTNVVRDKNANKSYADGVKDAFLNISERRPNYDDEMKSLQSTQSEDTSGDDSSEGIEQDPSSGVTVLEYCDNLIEALCNVSNGEMNVNTVLYGFVAALTVHIVTKILFGRLSIFVVVCVGMALMALVGKKQNILTTEITKLHDSNTNYRSEMRSVFLDDPSVTNNIDSKHEFWHADSDGCNKRPKFRERVKPFNSNYRGRRAQKSNFDAQCGDNNKKTK